MTTSGITTYNETETEIIHDAYEKINVVGTDETVSAEDYASAHRTLNRMIKFWQGIDYHLWLKETATIFLQKNQLEYTLNSTGDHATLSYVETTLSADEASGQVILSVTSSTGMNVDDYVGIKQDDNTLHWSTIKTIIDPTSIEINTAITDDAASGSKVYAYTTRLDQPFDVYSAVRESESQIDVPMNYLAYQEYFELPNKTSTGFPVSYNYNRKINSALIRIWPVPITVEHLIKITFARKIEDFSVVSNDPDFPQEWIEVLVLNLAVKLAPNYGKAGTPNFAEVKEDAKLSLMQVGAFDNEPGSIYFQPQEYF